MPTLLRLGSYELGQARGGPGWIRMARPVGTADACWPGPARGELGLGLGSGDPILVVLVLNFPFQPARKGPQENPHTD